ncbi:MAG: beta-propeller fold lactonase family protein [Nitrososphaeraceae archaeon]
MVVAKKIDEKGTEGSASTLSRRNIDGNLKDKFASGDNNNSSNHSKGLLPSCPDGSELIKGKCVCPDGSSPKNNKCSIQPNPKPIKCPDDSSMVDGKCLCPDGSEISKEKCVCLDDGSSPINGKCTKPSPPGSLTFLSVVKKVTSNDGSSGTKKPSDFTITVTGNDPSPSSFSGSSSGTSVTLRPGSYKVTETERPSGYTTRYSSGCSGTLDAGQTEDCTITNEANKSPEPKPLVTSIRGFSGPLGLVYDSNNKYVYVTNYGDSSSSSNNEAADADKVSIIDTSTDKVIDTVSVGKKPLAITYNPNNNHVYVANTFSDTVSVIDTLRNNNIISNIAVGHFPGNSSSGIAYNSNNDNIHVANIGSDSVSEIDGSTNAVTSTIKQLFNPAGIAYDPVNGYVYVANKESNTVSVIDTLGNNKVIATIPVGTSPSAIIFDSDNGHVYVANTGSDNSRDTISVIDTSINRVIATIPVSNGPNGITLDSSSGKIYVSNTFSNNVSVIDDSKNKVITTIPVGINPYGIVYNPSNHHIYVANHGSNTISVISP